MSDLERLRAAEAKRQRKACAGLHPTAAELAEALPWCGHPLLGPRIAVRVAGVCHCLPGTINEHQA